MSTTLTFFGGSWAGPFSGRGRATVSAFLCLRGSSSGRLSYSSNVRLFYSSSGRLLDSSTGRLLDSSSGRLLYSSTRRLLESSTGRLLDSSTRRPCIASHDVVAAPAGKFRKKIRRKFYYKFYLKLNRLIMFFGGSWTGPLCGPRPGNSFIIFMPPRLLQWKTPLLLKCKTPLLL